MTEKVAPFVEGIPGYSVQERIPAHYAKVDLGSELRLGLSADNGANMGFINTANAVLNREDPALKYLELLQVDWMTNTFAEAYGRAGRAISNPAGIARAGLLTGTSPSARVDKF